MMRQLCCLVYSVCLAQLSFGQLRQPSLGKTAVVNVRVNTAYDDSGASLTLLQTIARYAPYRRVPVAEGDTLDAVFVREYGFGQTDLPKSYALLLRVILERNHLERPEDLKPGALIIPAVPKRAWMRWGRSNAMNYVANMSIFPVEAVGSASASTNRKPYAIGNGITEQEPSELAYAKTFPSDAHRFTAPIELLQFGMPIDTARKLIEDKAFEKDAVTAVAFPLPVKLASANACDVEETSRDHETLTAEQKTRLSKFLEQQSQRSPLLFILDTGWPNYQAYQESRATLYEVLDMVWRSKFGMPFKKAGAQKTIPLAINQHCRCIERALRELRDLESHVDLNKKVKVIYIPLTREQGASTVLVDLLQTTNLLQRSAATNVSLNQGIIRGARNRANDLVKAYFPSRWSGEEVETDKSVLDAVLLVGQAYAAIAKSVFFVSESWTVNHEAYGGKYYVQYQTPQYGIVASAAGNDGTTTLLDFAQRSTSAKDTLAVINMNSTGVVPQSTRIKETYIDIAEAVGFDGSVTDDISGTSFSAPRVAWFLAAGEAVRKKDLTLDDWGTDLQLELHALRDPKATGYQKLLFDPVQYIEAQNQALARTGP